MTNDAPTEAKKCNHHRVANIVDHHLSGHKFDGKKTHNFFSTAILVLQPTPTVMAETEMPA